MGLLSYNELCALVGAGVIEGVSLDQINAASIDLTLGDDIVIESDAGEHLAVVDLMAKQTPRMEKIKMGERGFIMGPGDFCLAHTREVFHLPNDISGIFLLKSSLARSGLEHSQAGWADAGWHGSVLTLELQNVLRNHHLKLTPGMKIGQIVFFRHTEVPEHASYGKKGQYNGDRSVSASKGVR